MNTSIKKPVAIIAALVLSTAMLCACNSTSNTSEPENSVQQSSEEKTKQKKVQAQKPTKLSILPTKILKNLRQSLQKKAFRQLKQHLNCLKNSGRIHGVRRSQKKT